jgi:hypothetical protein
MSTRPSSRDVVALMCPRRADRSLITSPCAAIGTVTETRLIGSSTVVPAACSASRTPVAAAVRNAMSEESTECDLPS